MTTIDSVLGFIQRAWYTLLVHVLTDFFMIAVFKLIQLTRKVSHI